MTDDRGLAALAIRLADAVPELGTCWDETRGYWWLTTDVAAAILGEYGRFLPDGFDAVVMGEAWSASQAEVEWLRAVLLGIMAEAITARSHLLSASGLPEDAP